MSLKHTADLYSQLEKFSQSAEPLTPTEESSNFGAGLKSVNHALEISFPDPGKASKVLHEIIIPYLNTKLVRTQDFGTMRLPSVDAVMEELRNEYTPWLNFLESQPGGPEIADDFQYKWNIWDIGTDEADFIDHQTSIGTEVKSAYQVESNTVGCIAVKIVMTDLAINMLQRQRNVNILNREISAGVTRLRNASETKLLSNDEVTFEGPVPIPQPKGFLTSCTVSPQDLAGDDFTAPVLRGLISAIADISSQNGRGYRQLALLTNEQQLQVLRDIIVNEYNGIYPSDRVAFESFLVKQMRGVNMNVTTIFESLLGPSVPGILVPRLPANTSVLFEAALPRLIKMILGDTPGPYSAMRPNELFQRVEVVLDFISLKYGIPKANKLITGVNS